MGNNTFMQDVKQLTIRLFFNISNTSFYVQIGDDMICKIPATVATKIQEKEQLNIIHCQDIKDIQIICLNK